MGLSIAALDASSHWLQDFGVLAFLGLIFVLAGISRRTMGISLVCSGSILDSKVE